MQDSQWEEVSASLRLGVLHVKMPRAKVMQLLGALVSAKEDLLRKKVEEVGRSFVFSASTDDWSEDLKTLKGMESSEVVTELVLAVQAGLRNEARVDWVSRIGGPAREPDAALENLNLFGDDELLT